MEVVCKDVVRSVLWKLVINEKPPIESRNSPRGYGAALSSDCEPDLEPRRCVIIEFTG